MTRTAVAGRGAIAQHHHLPNTAQSDDVDMLLLSTHTDIRLAPTGEALARGMPVYIEKPVADNMPEMETIIRLSAEI